jgi:murein DD-endopeptidase MepM/ murein hydrolase activator NlpD
MRKIFDLIFVISLLLVLAPIGSRGASVQELRDRSADLTEEIRKLDKEIANLNGQLRTTKTQKSTLTSELAKIETARKKLLSELSKTEKQISIAGSNILLLSSEISVKQRDINQNISSMSEALRNMRALESDSLLELALAGGSLSDLIARTESLDRFQTNLEKNVLSLKTNKATLENKRNLTEAEKKSLTDLKSQLADQKQIVEQTKKEKDELLTATKNKESTYQKMIAERIKKKEQLDSEIANIERDIKIAIDPSLLPKTKGGALGYPLEKTIITQYFGNTQFAAAHMAVYNGKGHNGVDFGTPIGTPVMAAESGTIIGTGDTDKACPGASYGKWMLIEHQNGLSSLYGHLSVIKLGEGETVHRGQTIAYSGNTGYSTGPHLHFTVYASQGVKVSSLQSKVKGCGVYRMPVASYNSYLNPLTYLK